MSRKYNPTHISRDGLVAEYLLDGNANDTSGNGNNGTATNVTWVSANRGYVGKCASFNGINSKIQLPSSLWGSSFSFFTNWNSSTGAGTICAKNGTNVDFTFETTRLAMYDGTFLSVDYSSTPFPQDGKDHLVGFTISGTTAKIYFDGNLWASGTWRFYSNASNPIYLGVYGRIGYLNGKLGLSRFYNIALSEDRIKELHLEHLRKLGPTNAILSGDFPLYTLPSIPKPILEISKAQSGGVYYDQSGNGNNGTATSVTDSMIWKYNVMSFNGSSSYATLPDTSLSVLDSDFSISCWFNVDSSASSQGWIYHFGLRDMGIRWGQVTDNIQFQFYDGDFDSYLNYPVSKNIWYNIVIVREKSSGITMYLNSVNVASNSETGDASLISQGESIGRRNSVGQYFYGKVGTIRIYDQALTDTQIQQLYYSSKII